jgi:hypothetical protein
MAANVGVVGSRYMKVLFFSGFFFLSTEAIASGVSMRMTTPQPLHAHAMVTVATRK